MNKKLILPLLATVFTMGYPAKGKGQDGEGERKVRIEITTNENGQTEHVTREFDLSDGEALEDALRELGVFDEIGVINDGENLVIDLRRLSEEGGMLKDMSVALAMEEQSEPGPYLGVYGGKWCQSTCEDDKKKNKNNKAVHDGAWITHVIDDTPAQRAGLQDNDVITQFDGKAISDFSDLSDAIEERAPGDKVDFTYWRDGAKKNGSVTLGETERGALRSFSGDGQNMVFEMPEMDWSAMADAWAASSEPGAFLGVNGEDAENNGGARITDVIEGTSAETMGLQEGDVITMVNDTRIMSFGTLAEVIGTLEPNTPVRIEAKRNGNTMRFEGMLGQHESYTWTMEAPEAPEAPNAPGAPDAPIQYRAERERFRDEMRSEMDQVRREMDRLRQELRGEVRREMRVIVATIELDAKETDVLKQKGVTGLESAPNMADLQCFPNPSNGGFNLRFDAPDRGDLFVDVHDAAGERVYHETITGFKGRYERLLDLSDLADGTYYLVIGQNGKTLARKLVKE